jgi:outer membrane protein
MEATMKSVVARTGSVLLAALLVLATASVSLAAGQNFKRWSVGTQIMYLNPDVDENLVGLVSAEDTMTGGLTVEYFLTPNFSAELVAAVAHTDLVVKAGGSEIGSGKAWLLPPSLYVKYHPMPQWKISPYVGGGFCWILPWDETLSITGNRVDLKIDDAFGWAAKAGADIHIMGNLYANVDIMYLNAEHDAKVNGTKFDLDLKVWSYNIGMKYRF